MLGSGSAGKSGKQSKQFEIHETAKRSRHIKAYVVPSSKEGRRIGV